MNNEIHIYLGSGRIEEKSNYDYPAGERHWYANNITEQNLSFDIHFFGFIFIKA